MSADSNRLTVSPTIRQLAEQLAHWGESLIAHGRSPLRKIETFPTLLTPCGCQRPPLVFWINRDSYMAGALVLFPDGIDSILLETGRCCAQALGLTYFITWATKEITFWDAAPTEPVVARSFPLSGGAKPAPEDFQEGLFKLMEEAKVMAVIGAVPPPELSAHYLANLYRNTLIGARPLLVEAYREARIDRELGAEDTSAEILADRKNLLTLVRLLSLILLNPVSTIPQPEVLEANLRGALQNLPEELRDPLRDREDEDPLPEEAAVRFHLLYRRLTQLRTATDRDRHGQALSLLLEQDSRQLGGFPLPCTPLEQEGPILLVNPDRWHDEVATPLEIAPRPILAITALLRHLHRVPAAAAQASDAWQIHSPAGPRAIHGTLADGKIPEPNTRRGHLARLRSSWPTRRFGLPAKTPEWAWQFLHLLGMAEPGAVIELRLPDSLLAADFGRPLIQLLQEQFTLDKLDEVADGWLLLRAFKSVEQDHQTRFRLDNGEERRLPWKTLQSSPSAILILALALPDELWSLVETGQLRHLPADSWPSHQEEALFLFTRSTLGQFLWQMVGNTAGLPKRNSLHRELAAAGFPVPNSAGLTHLQRQFGRVGEPPPSPREIDRELASWLGGELVVPAIASGPRRRAARQSQPEKTELADRIGEKVFLDGIPRFPDHYLFDYYRPQMLEYSFEAPLTAKGQFFDTFELCDEAGKTLQVEGAEMARALLLASTTARGKTRIALPRDREIVAAILERYLADLQELRQDLLREAHRLTADPQEADRLAETIWKDRDLPPWKQIAQALD